LTLSVGTIFTIALANYANLKLIVC